MLTKLRFSNFKRLEQAEIELGDVVVFIGANNSGKSSALQSLLLWSAGVREWVGQRRAGRPGKRPGVTMSRLGLTQIPLRDTKHLWRNLHVADVQRNGGDQTTNPVYIDISVDGEDSTGAWQCGLEFYYANPESFYCRPLRQDSGIRVPVPKQAAEIQVALLPPLSGLSPEEPELQLGRINVLLGQGRSGEVLRNLCLRVFEAHPDRWDAVKRGMSRTFGVILNDPARDAARGIIELSYREQGVELDITSAGRGLQQVLLLLAHMHGNPNAVLLLDEPDAHLEVIRQREIYATLTELARNLGNQLIIASHSEIVLQDATARDVVVSFVGTPRRVDDRGSQILKALKDIRAEDYYQAERKGFVLYLEGSTDLAILLEIANLIGHPAARVLSEPFVVYVANQPKKVQEHFYGLREAKPNLRVFALFDHLERDIPADFRLPYHSWHRREIENYIATKPVLLRFAAEAGDADLVARAMTAVRGDAMAAAIASVETAFATLRRDPWSFQEKMSDDVLGPIFANYYERLNLSNRMQKTNYHVLVRAMAPADVPDEMQQVLDQIFEACSGSRTSLPNHP